MEKEIIKYQINGQLVDNTVTTDNTTDLILVPATIGTADEERIIAEMIVEDTGLRRETLRHVFSLQKRIIKRLLMTGMNVNTGLYYASVSFRGIIESREWNPEKNTIAVNFNSGVDLREAMANTQVNILGEKSSGMYIASTEDVSTRAQDTTATPGRAFTIKGGRIKVVGTDPTVGVTLTKGSQVIEVTEDMWVNNTASKFTFIMPTPMEEGTYELKLTTQYSGSNSLLKAPRTVSQTIQIGAGGGGGGSEDPGV